jgi:hypothetical protein
LGVAEVRQGLRPCRTGRGPQAALGLPREETSLCRWSRRPPTGAGCAIPRAASLGAQAHHRRAAHGHEPEGQRAAHVVPTRRRRRGSRRCGSAAPWRASTAAATGWCRIKVGDAKGWIPQSAAWGLSPEPGLRPRR